MIIYYNPDCSKCNQALGFLQDSQCSLEIRNYLETPPSTKELAELVALLGCRPHDLVRKKEALYQQEFEGKDFSDDEWLEVLAQNPLLLERPIVIDGKKAIIGRPPELVLELVNPKP